MLFGLSFTGSAWAQENLVYDTPTAANPSATVTTLQNLPGWNPGGGLTAGHLAPTGSTSGKSAAISGNTMTLNVSSGGAIGGRVSGALNGRDTDPVTGNRVFITRGSTGMAFGGEASSTDPNDFVTTVSGNSVTIDGGSVTGPLFAASGGFNHVHQGATGGFVLDNIATISSGSAYRLHGGLADSNANDNAAHIGITATVQRNKAEMTGGAVNGDLVGGGIGYALALAGNILDNTVTISGGSASHVAGGHGSTGGGAINDNYAILRNSVAISGGTVASYVTGGEAYVNGVPAAPSLITQDDVNDNTVTIGGGSVASLVAGGMAWAGSYASVARANVNGNTVAITDGGAFSGSLYGAYIMAVDAQATGNEVTAGSSAVNATNVYGGYHNITAAGGSGDASGNTVTFSKGAATGTLYGGSILGFSYTGTSAQANDNRVNIVDDGVNAVTVSGAIYGGNAQANKAQATGNQVAIGNSAVNATNALGGYSYVSAASGSGDASRNTVTIDKGKVTGVIYGGYTIDYYDCMAAPVTITATGNTAAVQGNGAAGKAYGGYVLACGGANDGNASGNTAALGGNGSVDQLIGGQADNYNTGGKLTVTGNRVNIDGGTVANKVYGGLVSSYSSAAPPATAEASGNIVTITAGDITADITGGEAATGAASNTAKNNVVDIGGTPTITSGKNLMGGRVATGGVSAGNTLNLGIKGVKVGTLAYFQTLNFALPDSLPSVGNNPPAGIGEAMITAAAADIGGVAAINVSLAPGNSGSGMHVGDTYVLIANPPINSPIAALPQTGVIAGYAYEMKIDSTRGLILILTGKGNKGQPPYATPIPTMRHGALAALALLLAALAAVAHKRSKQRLR